ncbi:hypothetical protein PBAC_26750 [Pedobacter glucosidilyticus]|nr:hypothetical protein PBAC_26750 [Pedobacter glucosidilyticus]
MKNYRITNPLKTKNLTAMSEDHSYGSVGNHVLYPLGTDAANLSTLI